MAEKQAIFWTTIFIFSIFGHVQGQNLKPNAAGSSSCGGVLELSSGTLDFSPVGSDFCMWVIKLPANSDGIQFQLTQIPPSSKLNLYSQEGSTVGQIYISPFASLTTADVNTIVDTNSSSLIAIWTPSSVKQKNESENEGDLLSFEWDELSAESQEEEAGNQNRDLNLVGGVSYVEADRGRFSWKKPGKRQQTLLWALNSKSSEPLDLKIETEFEKCDLADPCLCSYFGVYEVYEDFLRVVFTECGRSSNVEVSRIQPRLVALGFVNPEFRRDTNHVTLTWNGKESEEGTTTTTTTTESTTTKTTEAPITCRSGFPKSCSEIQFESGSNSSEFQNCLIYPNGPGGNSLEVLCDFQVDGGGWTLMQKRSKGPKEEFNRAWSAYANGFGSLDGNFWLGLEHVHALTKDGDQELRIELEDFQSGKSYAKYSRFSVSNSSDFYRLSISGFSGDAGDSMTNPPSGSYNLNGMRFTTKDKDNDNSDENCVDFYGVGGGWWFNDCSRSALNGLYFEKGETFSYYQGIYWYSWKGEKYSLAKSEMKIRTIK